jgi:hypothetical protein
MTAAVLPFGTLLPNLVAPGDEDRGPATFHSLPYFVQASQVNETTSDPCNTPEFDRRAPRAMPRRRPDQKPSFIGSVVEKRL